jgi:purine-binding chemotaxis protein CheW
MTELVLILTIAGRRCALRAPDVHSVVELGTVTPVPRAPEFVVGLTALRSSAMTVIDCARAIGLSAQASLERGSRAAVVSTQGHLYALFVDRVEDVAETLGTPTGVPGEAGPGWEEVSAGMIETTRGPALLIEVDALLRGSRAEAA